jgi:hypothetical protein
MHSGRFLALAAIVFAAAQPISSAKAQTAAAPAVRTAATETTTTRVRVRVKRGSSYRWVWRRVSRPVVWLNPAFDPVPASAILSRPYRVIGL